MFEQRRDEIVQYLSTAYSARFPSVPMAIDNQPFNWNSLPEVYSEVEIEFEGSKQLGIGQSPRTRFFGCVGISVGARQGTKTRLLHEVQSWFNDRLSYIWLNSIQFSEFKPAGSSQARGYYFLDGDCHFYFDAEKQGEIWSPVSAPSGYMAGRRIVIPAA